MSVSWKESQNVFFFCVWLPVIKKNACTAIFCCSCPKAVKRFAFSCLHCSDIRYVQISAKNTLLLGYQVRYRHWAVLFYFILFFLLCFYALCVNIALPFKLWFFFYCKVNLHFKTMCYINKSHFDVITSQIGLQLTTILIVD